MFTYKTIISGEAIEPRSALDLEHTDRVTALHGGIAEIAASGVPPGGDTDTAYFNARRIRDLEKQFPNSEQREQFIRDLKAAGKPDDVCYDPTNAHCPNDPGALTEAGSARSDDREQRATFVHEGPPIPAVRLNRRIVERNRRHRIALDPGLAERDQRELTEEIIERHAVPPL